MTENRSVVAKYQGLKKGVTLKEKQGVFLCEGIFYIDCDRCSMILHTG